ncbi:hypothetical protein, partial [Clostridium tarantellae]
MMRSKVFNTKYSIMKKNHIKVILFFIYLCITITIFNFLFHVNGKLNANETISNEVPFYIGNIILILCIIAYFSSLLYYYSNKDEDLFIVSLVYLNLLTNATLNIAI